MKEEKVCLLPLNYTFRMHSSFLSLSSRFFPHMHVGRLTQSISIFQICMNGGEGARSLIVSTLLATTPILYEPMEITI